jgi:hypothetical protein
MIDQCSSLMTAWLVVLTEPNDNDELVELIEVEARRIPASKRHRSQYDWFMDDHWENNADQCFWGKEDRPEPGEYLVRFHIEGGWVNNTNGSDYNEKLVINSVERVDLRAIPAVMWLDARAEDDVKSIEDCKEIIQQKLADGRAEHTVAAPNPAPRYDDVFFSGQEWLDDLAEGTVPEESGGLHFDPEMKSTTMAIQRIKELKAQLEQVRAAVESARGGTSFDHARALGEIDDILAKGEE